MNFTGLLLIFLAIHASILNAFDIFDLFENANGREYSEGKNAKAAKSQPTEGSSHAVVPTANVDIYINLSLLVDCKNFQCPDMKCVDKPSDCRCPPLYVKKIRQGAVICMRTDQKEL